MAVAAVTLIAPGFAITRILGARGVVAWATAGPASVSVIVIASLAAPIVGATWSVWMVLAVWIVVVAIAVGLRVLLRHWLASDRVADPGWPRWPIVLALVLGGVVIVGQLLIVVGDPENISQTFDNVFHLNAARYILETQNASPLHVGTMTSPGGGVWFYPSAWHAIVALVVDLAGTSIPMASNAVMIVVAAALWPASALLLAITLFGRASSFVLSAGVLVAAAPAFPILMIDYGVLYPFFLALALLPAVLALTVKVLGLDHDLAIHWAAALIVVIGSLPGLFISHPGAFVAWLVLTVIASLFGFVHLMRQRPARRTVWWASAWLAGFYIFAFVAWRVLRPPADARGWPPTETVGQAVGEVVTQSLRGGAVALLLAVLLVVGTVRAVRHEGRSGRLAATFLLVLSVLYIVASALPWNSLRDLMTAAWYNNSPRLAALVPLIVIPIAALGASAAFDWLRAKLPARVSDRSMTAISVLALAVLLVGTQGVAIRQAMTSAHAIYQFSSTSPLLTTDEVTLLYRLPDLLPEDAVIAGNPWTGTSLAYAIADRRVLMPHLLMDIDEDTAEVNEELADADADADVCRAVHEKGVQFVLDFGRREVHGAEHEFPGLDDLATSHAVRLVDRVGQARLYEVVACG